MRRNKFISFILTAALALNSLLPISVYAALSYEREGVYVKGDEDAQQYLSLLNEDLPSESKNEVVRPTDEIKAVNDTELMVVMKKEYSNPYYHMTLEHFPGVNAIGLKEYMKADPDKSNELINFENYRNILKFTFENNDDLEAAIEILSARPDIQTVSYNLEIDVEYDSTESSSAIYEEDENTAKDELPINGRAFVNGRNEATYVAEISGLDYKEVGFVFEYENKKVKRSTTTVYDSIEEPDISIEKTNDDGYLYAFTITNAGSAYDIYATPYAVNWDGSVIYGATINAQDTFHKFETADYNYRVYRTGYSKFDSLTPAGFKISSSDELKDTIYNYAEEHSLEGHKNAYDEIFEYYNDEFFKNNTLFMCFDNVGYSVLYKNSECSITDDTVTFKSTDELYYPELTAIEGVLRFFAVRNDRNINSVEWSIDLNKFSDDGTYIETINRKADFKN